MARVLITSEYFGKFSGEARALLTAAGHHVVDNPYGRRRPTTEEILAHIGSAEAIVCDTEPITRQVIDAAPELKIIARRGVGVDSVDIYAAQERGIVVARTLGIVQAPVAELVMSYMLEFSRNVGRMSGAMHAGRWERVECHSLNGKTLGIIGMGCIAMEVARRAAAFGMSILYHSTRENAAAREAYGARFAPMETVLAESDFVSLHVPLTDETRHLIGYDECGRMKPSAYVINTARGGVVDMDGLRKALDEALLAGAAIDVFDVEPNVDCPLKGYPNVILTPHVGTFTKEVFIQMDSKAAENIIDFFARQNRQQ